MALDFPSSPVIGEIYTFGSRSWQWDGGSWNSVTPTSLTNVSGVLAILNGGTGASDAATARANLGLGAVLTDIATLRSDVDTNTVDIGNLRVDVNALGTLSLQNANGVTITGGSITGITDLAVADGGTGASDAATARTNLGLGTMATQDASFVAITGGSAILSAANIGLLALVPELGYPTSGAIDLRFDLTNNAYIGLTGNTTFTASGFSSGRILSLTLKNTTGSPVTLAWPAWNETSASFPASLSAGVSLVVRAECYGNAVGNVFAQCSRT